MIVKFALLFLAIAFFLAACQGYYVEEQSGVLDTFSAFVETRNIAEYNKAIKGCSIPIRGHLKAKQPLYLIPGTTRFYPLSSSGRINVPAGRNIEIHCTSEFANPLSGKNYNATCVSGSTFTVNGVQQNVLTLVCKTWPKYVAKRSGKTCKGGTTLMDVGFELSSDRFLKQYEVCFNENREVTRYVYYQLFPGSNFYERNVENTTFRRGDMFNRKNMTKIYSLSNQKDITEKALGYSAISNANNMFLTPGQLVAKEDFMYGSQQRATFLYVNAAPQWYTFNTGNWARVENGLRNWVTKNKKTVDCWAGVYGITSLPDIYGDLTPLYLDYDENENELIPVPKFFYKVVIEPSTNKGIVFIGVNNPCLSLKEITKRYILCPDVSDKVTFIDWNKHDILSGYMYACEVNAFRKKVKNLPTFNVSGLLL